MLRKLILLLLDRYSNPGELKPSGTTVPPSLQREVFGTALDGYSVGFVNPTYHWLTSLFKGGGALAPEGFPPAPFTKGVVTNTFLVREVMRSAGGFCKPINPSIVHLFNQSLFLLGLKPNLHSFLSDL